MFDKAFKEWVLAACKEWDYPEPTDEYFSRVYSRLPKGLGSILSIGLRDGLIIPKGGKFGLSGLPAGKGPYSWFSKYADKKEPSPNWEYFIQVAEYIRLHSLLKPGQRLMFEDDLMDLAVYDGDKLFVCYEVKEKARQLQSLISKMKKYQKGIDYSMADRGNDPLRKAKYIAHRQPEYFCGVAIGVRYEFRVSYPEGYAFQLHEDMAPLI